MLPQPKAKWKGMRCTEQRPYASATGASAQIGGLGGVGPAQRAYRSAPLGSIDPLPLPRSGLVQLLIHRRRNVDDRARDVLYIYDTLQLFGSQLPELRTEWRVHLAPQIPDRTLKALARSSRPLFV